MLPRISSVAKLWCIDPPLYLLKLSDWQDAQFPNTVIILYSQFNGAYCVAETADHVKNYSQLLFPGIATTCFEEMSYSTYVEQMKG